jgi:hypothetical protein
VLVRSEPVVGFISWLDPGICKIRSIGVEPYVGHSQGFGWGVIVPKKPFTPLFAGVERQFSRFSPDLGLSVEKTRVSNSSKKASTGELTFKNSR